LFIQKIRYHANPIDLLKLELQALPEGSMKINKRKFYFQAIKGKEVNITQNKVLLAQYCRKALVLFLIKHLEKKLTLPAHLHKELSIKEIIAMLPASYQGFPLHYYFHSQYNDWLKIKNTPLLMATLLDRNQKSSSSTTSNSLAFLFSTKHLLR